MDHRGVAAVSSVIQSFAFFHSRERFVHPRADEDDDARMGRRPSINR
jgi:hypothetical protein